MNFASHHRRARHATFRRLITFSISSNTSKTFEAGASCTVTVDYSGSSTNTSTLYVSANGRFMAVIPIFRS